MEYTDAKLRLMPPQHHLMNIDNQSLSNQLTTLLGSNKYSQYSVNQKSPLAASISLKNGGPPILPNAPSMISKASLKTIHTFSQKPQSVVNPSILGESEQLRDFTVKAWLRKLSKKNEDIRPKYLMNE
jgi:hypothetical protein